MTSVALLSDIHANLPALEAVIAEIDRCRPDAVFVLGDLINGCAWPAETLDLLMARGWPVLVGNHDDAVLQLGTARMEPRYADREHYATLWWTRSRIGPSQVSFVGSLPLELAFAPPDAPPVRLLHGLPGNFFVGFRPDSPVEWSVRHLAPVAERTVAGGHTHFPMVRAIGRWQVINTGSVGASYDGDPRAAYVWMAGDGAGWQAEIRRVEYDRGLVDDAFGRSGLRDEGGVLGEMFHRTVMSGQPYVSDFNWWVRKEFGDGVVDMRAAMERYDREHGPGRWAFPLAGLR